MSFVNTNLLYFKVSPQPPQPPITTTLQTQSNANFQPKAISTSSSLSHSVQNYVKELEISEGQLSSCIKYKKQKIIYSLLFKSISYKYMIQFKKKGVYMKTKKKKNL